LILNVSKYIKQNKANANIFTSPPQDYYSEKNNTKGNLCATAYRTLGTDGWNFKYYRYDARGRVKKMWNYINGFGWKTMEYQYNSQNQVTEIEYRTTSDNDHKVFSYEYDKSGRLKISATDETRPPLPFAEYRYNQNSQIDSVFYNNGSYFVTNYYNNRNWVTQSNSSNNKLNYMLDYLANGNISSQNINGDYKGNFSDTKEFRVNYVYDNSNRLTEVERFSTKYFDMSGEYSFDPDGNFLSLTRSYNNDNFSYDYYSGTNKLKKVSGSTDQFTYDYNGNLINDYFNNNTDIKYDHRNLITEITRVDDLIDPPATYTTTYKYDEAGNRTNKTVTKDDGSTMEIIVNEYYIRDVSGKEIAIYQNDTLKFWNVWGLGNEGRINSDGTRYYYIKDHLGSTRAVLNDSNNLVETIDYDAWGHIARYWSSTSSKYKFTGKERDNETGYDYFGARYYDARIGRWGQMDPLFEKYITVSPYSYVLVNPLIFIDPNGKWRARYDEVSGKIYVTAEENDKFEDLYSQLGMTKDEFFEKYKDYINDPENFELNAGFELDITEQVIGNAKFSDKLSNGFNCFSSCIAAMGFVNNEIELYTEGKNLSQILESTLGFKKETENKTGFMNTFEDLNKITHHAAIYVIRSQKGIEYFFGRPGPNSKLSIQTSDILNQLYPDFKTYILSYPKSK
jgi:RHS repeat-associated protein